MKYKLPRLFALSILLINCSCSPNINSSNITSYNYDDIVDFSIDFEQMFSQKEVYYFVYFYSLHCLHCELIKNEVISYSLSNFIPMYFIEYDSRIKVSDDVSETIGLKDCNNFSILGTPSLVLINNYQVSLNVAGMDLIKSILNDYKSLP